MGDAGLDGKPGLDAPLSLSLELVLVAQDYGNLDRLPTVEIAARACKEWWRENVGINLTISGRCLQSDLVPTGLYTGYLPALRTLHYWELGGHTPTVFIFSEYDRVGEGYLGAAFPDLGIAMTVGFGTAPGQNTILDEIIGHELAHILLKSSKHEEGTFLAAALEEHNRIVTQGQREQLRLAATQFGGF